MRGYKSHIEPDEPIDANAYMTEEEYNTERNCTFCEEDFYPPYSIKEKVVDVNTAIGTSTIRYEPACTFCGTEQTCYFAVNYD